MAINIYCCTFVDDDVVAITQYASHTNIHIYLNTSQPRDAWMNDKKIPTQTESPQEKTLQSIDICDLAKKKRAGENLYLIWQQIKHLNEQCKFLLIAIILLCLSKYSLEKKLLDVPWLGNC